jgi:hypothetical protein
MLVERPSSAWWITFCGLVVSLSVNWVLPTFDHHVVEYSPFHNHVVLNAASASDRHQALVAHTDGSTHPHSHTAPAARDVAWASAPASHAPSVIGTSLLTDLLALAASVVHVIVAHDWLLPQPVLALWLLLLPAAMLLLRRVTPPPEKPPRSL